MEEHSTCSVRLSPKTKRYMDRHKEINWSEVMRSAIHEYIDRIESVRTKEAIKQDNNFREFCRNIGGDLRVLREGKTGCRIDRTIITLDTDENCLSIGIIDDAGRDSKEIKLLCNEMELEVNLHKRYPSQILK